MWKRFRPLMLVALMAQVCGAAAIVSAGTSTAVATGDARQSQPSWPGARRASGWRSSSSSAVAVAVLKDLARRGRRGRTRNLDARHPTGLARVLKRAHSRVPGT